MYQNERSIWRNIMQARIGRMELIDMLKVPFAKMR